MKSLPVKPRLVLPFCGLLLLTSLTYGTYAIDDHQLGSEINRISDQGDETQPEPPTDEEEESTDTGDEDEDVGNAPTPGVEDESTDILDEEDESTEARDEEDESTDILDGANESTEARDEEDGNAFTLGVDDESTDISGTTDEQIDQVVQQIAFDVPEERKDTVVKNAEALLSDIAIQVDAFGGDSSQALIFIEDEVAADPQGGVANMIRAYAEEGFTPDDTRRIGNKIAQGDDVKEVLENEKAQGEDVKEVVENEKEKSSCLIATAAFGSELAPQVELLRNFRDNYILSTAAGSSFMNVFNAWYYSFSPYIADYEREQPWLKQITRIAIYPLLGVLQLSEKAYLSLPGEYGALAAGATASSLIGVIYFWPIGMIVGKRLREAQHSRKSSFKYISAIMGIVTLAVISAIVISDGMLLMITASLFVLTIIMISATLLGKLAIKVLERVSFPRF